MLNFSESSEFTNKSGQRVDVINTYIAMLRRAPTKAEVDTALAAMQAGGDLTDLIDDILRSSAYAATVPAS